MPFIVTSNLEGEGDRMDSIELNNKCCRVLGFTRSQRWGHWEGVGVNFAITNQLKDRPLFDCDMGFVFLMVRASGCDDLEGTMAEVSERCLRSME